MMLGELKVVDLEWINTPQEIEENYYVYRHFGNPFDSDNDGVQDEFAISNYTDDGWELYEGPIAENSYATMIRQVPVPLDSQRDVWYAIIVADSFGNFNPTYVVYSCSWSTIIVSLNEEDEILEFESVEAPNEPEVDFADSDS